MTNETRNNGTLKDKTLKELLENPLIAAVSKDAIRKMDLSEEEYYTWMLQEIAEKMGWKNLERGFTRLLEIASRGEYCYKLYDTRECEGNQEKETAHVVFFPSDDPKADERPFILLIPGGGLVNVWNLTEGWPVGYTFNELGYHVVILTYQVDMDAGALVAMGDIARALEMISKKREEVHLDPSKYITCGFSSGGYLACLWNSEKGYRAYGLAKPMACFPVYSMTSYRLLKECVPWENEEEMEECAVETVGCSMEEACNSCFEIPEHVEGFPPTYIVTMEGDNVCNPEHSKMLAKALEEAKIPCKFELGPDGWHGFADGIGMSMEGWPERAVNWVRRDGSF